MPANEQAELIASNVRLTQENRKLLLRIAQRDREIHELKKIARAYRAERLKGYRRRRDASEIIRACWIGAVLAVGAQAVSYGIFELWQFLHGWI